MGNDDKVDSSDGLDYGDDYDTETYDDIENYDTKTALEKLDLGWGLNSSSVLGSGFPKLSNFVSSSSYSPIHIECDLF